MITNSTQQHSIGWGDGAIFAHYGPMLTRQRRLFNDAFGKHAVDTHQAIQEKEARILLKGLLVRPDDFDRHASRFVLLQHVRAPRLLLIHTKLCWRNYL